MGPIDYILLGGIALIVVGVVVWLIKKKKKGEMGCGCGCSGCPNANVCGANKGKNEENERV